MNYYSCRQGIQEFLNTCSFSQRHLWAKLVIGRAFKFEVSVGNIAGFGMFVLPVIEQFAEGPSSCNFSIVIFQKIATLAQGNFLFLQIISFNEKSQTCFRISDSSLVFGSKVKLMRLPAVCMGIHEICIAVTIESDIRFRSH